MNRTEDQQIEIFTKGLGLEEYRYRVSLVYGFIRGRRSNTFPHYCDLHIIDNKVLDEVLQKYIN